MVFAGWPAAAQVREQTMAAAPPLNVDADPNGGVQVKGWSRSEVLVRARVDTWAPTDGEAKAIAGRVRIVAQGGRIHAESPSHERREGWSVSFEVFTPHKTSLTARANNGGMHIDFPVTVRGEISKRVSAKIGTGGAPLRFTTTNGGVHIGKSSGSAAVSRRRAATI